MARGRRTVSVAERKATAEPIARMIRTVAKTKGVKLKFVIQELEITEASFYGKLKGNGPFEIAELAKIARTLDVPVTELYREPDELWAARDSNPEPTGLRVLVPMHGHLLMAAPPFSQAA